MKKHITQSLTSLALTLLLTLGAAASAQAITLGATYNPVTPNGQAFGVQATYEALTLDLGDTPVTLGARLDATTPLSFDLAPSVNLAVTALLPADEGITAYAGTGIGRWVTTIDGEPCYDITWTLHAGADIDVADNLAVRADFQAAPLIGDINLGIGLAYTLNLP